MSSARTRSPPFSAAGMTFVILIAGIDLSVGSVVGLAGVMCADVLVRGHERRRPSAWASQQACSSGSSTGLGDDESCGFRLYRDTGDDADGARGGVHVHGRADDFGAARPFAVLSSGASSAAMMAAVFAAAWFASRERRSAGTSTRSAATKAPRGCPASVCSGLRLAVYAICG